MRSAAFSATRRFRCRSWRIRPDEIILSAAPLTHLYGLFAYHLSLCSGAAMSLLPAFTPGGACGLIEKHKANCVFAGPAHFKPLLDAGLLEKHDFSSMRFACLSGSPVPPELAAAVEAKLKGKGRTIQLWGMTELQAGSFSRPSDAADVRHGTRRRSDARDRAARGGGAAAGAGFVVVQGIPEKLRGDAGSLHGRRLVRDRRHRGNFRRRSSALHRAR